jgi:TfoX/Sxy family transcriptional regulator of competence genes
VLTVREESEDRPLATPGAADAEVAGMLSASEEIRDRLVIDFQDLGPVVWKAMFGGFGLYVEKGMFCLIDADARPAFRVSELTVRKFKSAGGKQLGRHEFWTIPSSVLSNPKKLNVWAAEALQIASEMHKGRFRF